MTLPSPLVGRFDQPSPSSTGALRVAHVTDFYLPRLGGIERHVSDLARAQRGAGHEVDVVTVEGRVESNLQPLDVAARSLASLASWSPRAIGTARDVVLSGRYDVVHVHASLATPLSFSVASAASRAGLPTVVTMHSILGGFGTLLRGVDPIAGWRRWPVEWTAVSRTGAADLSRALGEGRSVTVLPNAIDVDRWRIDQPAPHDDVHIVAVMRLARRKRPLPLLEMLRCVRERMPDDVKLRATIIGDGPRHRSMARVLTAHGMGPWVDLPGRHDHDAIRDVFRTADLFVAPAVRESFGIAALEGRAAGLPVIAMERSGIAEFVEHERSGLLAADDAAMVRAICALVSDHRLRAAITEHNRSTRPQYSWDRAVAATEALYSAAERRQLGRSLERNDERRVQIGVA